MSIEIIRAIIFGVIASGLCGAIDLVNFSKVYDYTKGYEDGFRDGFENALIMRKELTTNEEFLQKGGGRS